MKKQMAFAVLLLLFSTLANAHPDHGLVSAYSGFMHPLTGLDHLLVMLAIGVWAAQLGGHARWQLPLTFIAIMALGALLGLAGFAFTGVETLIAASVMAMGVILMLNLQMSLNARLGVVAIFAVFHGMAHGVELNSQSNLAILGGLLCATALLHGIGLLIGLQREQAFKWLQSSLAYLMLLMGSYLLLS